MHNYGDKVYGKHTFAEAMAQSINTTFAKVGVELGADVLARYAAGVRLQPRGPRVVSERGAASSPTRRTMDEAHVAQVSFGQGEVLATPLEMALVAAGIANGGQIMAAVPGRARCEDYQQTVLVTAAAPRCGCGH